MPWQHVTNWPSQLTAIHAAHLFNNRIMMWGYGNANSDRDCKAWILNLVTGEFFRVDCTVNNIFCAGHAMLVDGRVLVAGGTDGTQPGDGNGWGTRFATLLAPDATEAGAHWEETQEMGSANSQYGRWYPTVTLLPDGRLLVVTGTQSFVDSVRTYNKKVQLFNPNDLNPWFTSPIDQQLPLYPAMFVLPSGLVLYAGRDITPTPPGDKTLALRLSDLTWHVVTSGFTDGGIGEHNSACSFSPGKILRCGGNLPNSENASALAVVIDLSNWQDGQPASWQTVAPMNHARRDHTLVALPNGLGSLSSEESHPKARKLRYTKLKKQGANR